MEFGLTEEHRLLQETLRGFAAKECPAARLRELFESGVGHDPQLWRGLAEIGVTGLAIPDAYGGAGLEILDLALAAETLGIAALPGPFLGHALCGLAILWGGSAPQRERWLPRLAAGDAVGTIAFAEVDGACEPDAWTARAQGGRLSGAKAWVPFGAEADLLVVGTAGGGLALVERSAPGVGVSPVDGLDRTRPLAGTSFAQAPCEPLADGAAAAGRVRDAGLVLLAADAFGAAETLLEQTVAYARTREQFGQPIAQFQAVKHQLADLATEIEPMRGLVWYAAHAQDHVRDDAERSAAIAKAHVTDCAALAARTAVQLHGGIGFTWECDVQIWMKRALFDRALLGSPEMHRERQARLGDGSGVKLEYGEKYERFRAELREFLGGWPLAGAEAGLPLPRREAIFRQRGVERGYVYREFPKQYGGSEQEPDALADAILREEYWRAGAPGDLLGQGPSLLAPTLLALGTQAQRERFIPPTLRGEMVWCQGYSEPGSGSDLASVSSRAALEGDRWVIHGQKIWTSRAAQADWMFGLFRTEPDAPKHAGISYLLIPMDQPGIDVRPLKQISGSLEFNEVFLDGAVTAAENVVGRRGEGWQVSRVTLLHERKLMGNPHLLREHWNQLLDLARRTRRDGRPVLQDPVLRQRLASIEGRLRCAETSTMRQLTAAARGLEHEVLLSLLVTKLYSTQLGDEIARCAYDLLGPEGLLAPTQADIEDYGNTGTATGFVEQYLFSLGPLIAGGASNIQRNIIGERALGLPRDLRRERAGQGR